MNSADIRARINARIARQAAIKADIRELQQIATEAKARRRATNQIIADARNSRGQALILLGQARTFVASIQKRAADTEGQ